MPLIMLAHLNLETPFVTRNEQGVQLVVREHMLTLRMPEGKMTSKKPTSRKSATKKETTKSRKKSDPDIAAPAMFTDRRAMEKVMVQMSRLMSEQEFDSIDEANAFLKQFIGVKDLPAPAMELTPLERAQDIMYEAWGADGERRVELAREALDVSPDCADAYVLLAEETAEKIEEAQELYEQGVQAGERALGPEAFNEGVGYFWGATETRPYMRAREGLAECLWLQGKRKQAIEHYLDMLRLNPNDNQGVRYVLATLLLKEGADDKLGELFAQYPDDGAAVWVYSRALWLFRREGASPQANQALNEAFERNPFVPLYLMTLEEMPDELPEYIGMGDDSEAISYVAQGVEGWLETPDAIEWFANQMLAAVGQEAQKPRQRKKARSAKKR